MKQVMLFGLIAALAGCDLTNEKIAPGAGTGDGGGDAGAFCDQTLFCIRLDQNGCCPDHAGQFECMTPGYDCGEGMVLMRMSDCTCGGNVREDGGCGECDAGQPDAGGSPDAGADDAGLGMNPSAGFGTGNIMDYGLSIMDTDLQSSWTASVRIGRNGTFSADVRFTYAYEKVPKITPVPVGSAIFLQVWATYVFTRFGDAGDWALGPIIPMVCNDSPDDTCSASYEGTYEVPAPTLNGGELYLAAIHVSLSRVRLMESGGWRYYQWYIGEQRGRESDWLEFDQAYQVAGTPRDLYPKAESDTGPAGYPIGEQNPYGQFDYVAWMKQNLPAR